MNLINQQAKYKRKRVNNMAEALLAIYAALCIYTIVDAPKVHNGGYCPPDKVECQQDKK